MQRIFFYLFLLTPIFSLICTPLIAQDTSQQQVNALKKLANQSDNKHPLKNKFINISNTKVLNENKLLSLTLHQRTVKFTPQSFVPLTQDKQHLVVKFNRLLTAKERQNYLEQGIEILNYLQRYTYVISVN